MKIRFSDEARQYVHREKRYLAAHSRRASVAFSQQIRRAMTLILEHPAAGPPAGPVGGVRRYVSTPYTIYYVIRGNELVVVSIWHGRQMPGKFEMDEDPFA